MCMMVYVASGRPLPELSCDKPNPAFYVVALEARDEAVRRQFRWPLVSKLGSRQGCGCGFDWESFEDANETEAEWIAARESRRRLSKFLTLDLRDQPEIELFACWDGNQGTEPEFRGRVRPVDLISTWTSLQESEWLRVGEAPGPT